MLTQRRSKAACIVALLLGASLLRAEVKVLKNFTLIDGSGLKPLAGAAMIVDAGRIVWVGPATQLQVPAGAQMVDLTGKYVMPGIINLHGHLGNTVDMTQDAKFFTRENVEKNLATYASYGVTAMLSMGTDQDQIFQIRDQQRAGRPSMTRVFTAGQGFIFKGGYGGIAGVNQGVSTAGEVESAVAAQARKNVDIIKLWMDDELGKLPKMPYPIAKAIIDGAHQHHLRVTAHVFYLQDARQLTDYGVDSLAHSVRDKPGDRALIESMKAHGTWQMAATLSREASMFVYAGNPAFISDPFFTRGVSPAALKRLHSPAYQKTISSGDHFKEYPSFLETAKKNLKTLVDGGVKYGFGTDTGPPGRFPGYFEHWEMELMVEAGLTPMQVLTAATRNAAEFLGAKDLGTLERSKWADLIVLDRNPLDDIKNTRTINAVYIAGNRVR
ncbi:MAG TPA: amidohydrolase family protein [Candidatus Acidoferrales bacterium]|jgi:imidazolonepropionase-like amidohydrolase|nr:amidohydrolase family protein [Candidatus Acidoferrales bacterium]